MKKRLKTNASIKLWNLSANHMPLVKEKRDKLVPNPFINTLPKKRFISVKKGKQRLMCSQKENLKKVFTLEAALRCKEHSIGFSV